MCSLGTLQEQSTTVKAGSQIMAHCAVHWMFFGTLRSQCVALQIIVLFQHHDVKRAM